MAKKKHIIDFPEGKGRYCYLFWIDKVKYNKQRKVDIIKRCLMNPYTTILIIIIGWSKLFQSHSFQNMA